MTFTKRSPRRALISAVAIATLLTGAAACSGDDSDTGVGGTETTVDLDPGAGSGVPGDTDTSVDLDPGSGSGLPGDSKDESPVTTAHS